MSTRPRDEPGAPSVIDLGKGHPDTRLLPAEAFAEAARLAAGAGPALLQYTERRGPAGFRAALARWLATHDLGPVSPQGLCVTAGASHALDLVARQLAAPGDLVLVEEPTYFLALGILRGRGLRVRGVPLDDGGPDLAALERALAERPRLFYAVPTFHNPTGATWSDARRRAVVARVRAAGTTLVADEVYPLLHFGTPPPPPLRRYDPAVVSLGSFSKIFGPGLRLGWVAAPPETVDRLIVCPVLTSGGSIAPAVATLGQMLLEHGLQDPLLATFRRTYQARSEAMVEALGGALGLQAPPPEGGFFVWIELPGGLDAQALLPAVTAAGSGYRPGAAFSACGGLRSHIRLSFSRYDEDEIRLGVERLASVVHRTLEA